MSVYGIELEKMFDLLGHLLRGQLFFDSPDSLEHGYWSQLVNFSDASEEHELIVCDAHVFFVCLCNFSLI